MSTQGRPYTPTDEHNELLRSLYKQHTASGSTPDTIAKALLTKGLDGGMRDDQVRAWAIHTGDIDLGVVATSTRRWSRHVRNARQHIKASKTAPNREALTETYVRRWVTHLLTNPVTDKPAHPRATLGARQLVARLGHTIAAHTAKTGWDTTLTWRAALTVPLGLRTADAASGRMRTARAVQWVRVVRERGDHGLILKPGRVRAVQRHALPADVVDAIVRELCGVLLAEDPVERDAAREALGPAARLLLSADHAAWVYDDRLSLTTLIVVLADGVGVDPVCLDGVSRDAVRESRRLAKNLLDWDGSGRGLEAALNRLGSAGAFAAHERALEEREKEKEKTAAQRVEDQQIRDAMSYALDRVGPVMGPDDDRAAANDWAIAMASEVVKMGLDKRGQGTARRDLTRRLERAGWAADTAKSIAARIAPTPTAESEITAA